MLTDPFGRIAVEFGGNRGVVVGYVSRGRTKKIVAIVICRRSFHDVPLSDLKVVRAPKKK